MLTPLKLNAIDGAGKTKRKSCREIPKVCVVMVQFSQDTVRHVFVAVRLQRIMGVDFSKSEIWN